MHTVEIVSRIKEINSEKWDSLTSSNIFSSYGWLKTVEETFIGDVKTKYILVHEFGKLIGTAVCYISIKTDSSDINLNNFMFGKVMKYTSKLGISFMPAFICCPMKCYGEHFMIQNGIDDEKKRMILDELLDAIEKEALEKKLSVSFTNVMDEETALIQLLDKRGYHKTLGLPLNYLDIEWSSFEGYKDYISCISKKMKKNIANQINRNRREGVIIKQLEELDVYEDRLYELAKKNHLKYHRNPFPFKREYFRILKENLGKNAVIYVSIKKDRLTGVTVYLRKNKVGYFSFIGVDHELTGNDFTYFNLGYYRPIFDAISDNTTRIYDGTVMYALKAKRGYKTRNTFVFYKSFSKIKNSIVKPWFGFHSLWVRKNYLKW